MADADYELGEDRRARLAAVLDLLIPPDARRGMPGAGEVCVDAIEAMLRATPMFRLTVEPGLDWFASRESGVESRKSGIDSRESQNAADALQEIQEQLPAFVPTLVFLAYSAYYQQPRVVAALGLEGRPPHPRGYAMEASDLDALLAGVRARGRLYRES